MSKKQWGMLFAALGALLLCNGDVRCAIRKTLSI